LDISTERFGSGLNEKKGKEKGKSKTKLKPLTILDDNHIDSHVDHHIDCGFLPYMLRINFVLVLSSAAAELTP
jgi:hypothetical protein